MTMTTTAGEQGNIRRARLVPTVLAHAAGTLLCLVLLPVLVTVFGMPFAAWAIAFALVVANRLVHVVVEYSVRNSSLTVALGALGFSMIFRALLTALTLFFVGTSVGASGDSPFGLDRPDLARPALLIFVLCFTLDAGIEAIRRAGQREELLATDAAATTRETTA